MVRNSLLAGAALLVGTLAGCGSWHTAKARIVLNQTAEHVAGSGLIVDTRNGAITAEASADHAEVAIEAKITCGGDTQEEADARVAEAALEVGRDARGRLVVRPVFPGGKRSGDGASIAVFLPDAQGVELYSSNGSIKASGLGGPLVIDTSNGSISVTDHDGEVQADSSNGGIVVRNATGPVRVDTSNGGLRLENVGGRVHADTSNGSITVVLGPDHAGPVHLDTSNGPISLRVGASFTGSVTLSTSNASVSVHDTLGRVTSQSIKRSGGRVVVGEGGETSRLDTSNGRIELTIGG